MGRAVIYCRISSDREGRSLGVQRQERDCRDLAARLHHDVVRVFVDNDTGASRHSRKPRPEFEEMVRLAGTGQFDAIISWSTSRLTRRPLEHEALIPLFEQHRIMIHTVKAGDHDYSTARGRRRAREDAARDAEEVEEAAERIRAQKIQAAMRGEWRGGRRPYGFGLTVGIDVRNGAPLIDHDQLVPEEAEEIANAVRDVLAGVSLRSIAAGMNARGRTTSTGKPWSGTEVRAVLRRARNAGLVEVKREDGTMEVVAKAKWPAIVSEEEWRACVALLDDPSRRTNRANVARRWLGSGLFVCAVCGDTVRATKATARPPSGGSTVYRCGRTDLLDRLHVSRLASYTDEIVEKAVLGFLSKPSTAARLQDGDQTDVKALRVEAVTLRRQLDEADDMYVAGELDRRRLMRITERVRGRLSEVEARLSQVAASGPLAGLIGAADVRAAWELFDIPRRQAVVELLCEVVLHPGQRGRPAGWRPGERYFDPRTVELRWRR